MHGGDDKAAAVGPLSSAALPILSVIVPFRKSERCVLDCLRSLFDMDYPSERLEVIVVDDSHDDSTAEMVRTRFPAVRLLRNSTPLGADGSKQAGVEASTGDIVAYTDADCVVCPRWARVIAKNLSAGVEVVTGPVRHPKTFLRELVGVSDFQDFQSNVRRWVDNFTGCNFATSREVFRHTRYQMVPNARFGSDRLVSWHLHMTGLRILYDPAMEVYHSPAVNSAGLLERRLRYGRKALALRRIDPTLPGAVILRFGPLAAPAYICYKVTKDAYRLLQMTGHGFVSRWHAPLLFPALVLLRLMDALVIASDQLRRRR